ncbi:hypothetical protein [Aquitalea denitrificans]|uniref:hypothetical protein n=1 Tax=Aquitalea denitrificans TaxID=519081 RepID=UPI001357F276|nr:hypothetical protein [Aquitalea denitrificans]
MKYIFITVIAISMLWEWGMHSEGMFLWIYRIGLGGVMWGSVTLIAFDFYAAVMKKNSSFMQEFYETIKKDLFVCLIVGLSFVAFFSMLPIKYNFTNFDVAGLGVSFFVYGFFALIECGKLKVAGHFLPKRIILAMLALILFSYIGSFYILGQVVLNKFSPMQSLWYQISILCSAIFIFTESNRMRFFLEKERVEVSPVLLELFASFKKTNGLYQQAALASEQWNAHVKKLKIEARTKKKNEQRKRKR